MDTLKEIAGSRDRAAGFRGRKPDQDGWKPWKEKGSKSNEEREGNKKINCLAKLKSNELVNSSGSRTRPSVDRQRFTKRRKASWARQIRYPYASAYAHPLILNALVNFLSGSWTYIGHLPGCGCVCPQYMKLYRSAGNSRKKRWRNWQREWKRSFRAPPCPHFIETNEASALC